MYSRMRRAGLILGLVILAMPAIAVAQQTSPSYQMDEIFIGGGGELDSCSGSYCADQSVGGTGGFASSNNFTLDGGYGTPDQPRIIVDVTSAVVDLGVLNTSGTSAATSEFTVGSYLSDGYIVRVYGNAPTNVSGAGTHSLYALNAPNPSTPGTEQFGINLVENDNPGIGDDPVQYPDGSFAYGEAVDGYNQQDMFKYVDGDIIAESTQATGETHYTMSIIANIANSTPGGQYRTTLVIQAIATF